jgi:hypothetical protein
MKTPPLFSALSSSRIAILLRGATSRVVYAAPGIHRQAAEALESLASGLLRPEITVSLDVDERTLRMGYGRIEAVEVLRRAGITINHSPGFRSGVLIVDSRGWIFTPVPLYLEDEPQSDETPNAIELAPSQVESYAVRFCPATRKEAIAKEPDPVVAMEIAELPLEFGVTPLADRQMERVSESIRIAPPVEFDVVRQVRVFEPYLQYVEMHLTGAAVQKRRVQIPAEIQRLGASADLQGRLKTTFDLLKKSSELSSKKLEERLNKMRKDLTRTLGKKHGRVVLKSAKPTLQMRIDEFRAELETHQKKVAAELQTHINESKNAVVDFYLPIAIKNPPDSVIGETLGPKPGEDHVRKWLARSLDKVFPTAEQLISKMTLDVTYKDVTFETLNHHDFLKEVKVAFPRVDWDKTYNEFRAAGEKSRPERASDSNSNRN